MSRLFGIGRGSLAGVVAYVVLIGSVVSVVYTSLSPLAH